MGDRPQENETLRLLMKEHGYTRDSLADAMNAKVEVLFGRPGRCSARLVGRWLTGEVDWPRERSRLPLEALFGRPAHELGFRAPAQDYCSATVLKSRQSAPSQDPPVLRRQFLIGVTGTLMALPPLPDSGRLGMSDVNRVRAAALQLHRLDDLHGGAELVAVAARYASYVEDAARRCTYGSKVQDRLHTVLGELATSAGWFAFDAQQHDVARRHWDNALRHALLGRNTSLQARVFSSLSHQAWQLGHGGEAVSIARAALDQTRGRRDGQLSALLHIRVAQGHAVQGEGGWCGRSLLRAEQAYDLPVPEPQAWLGWFNPGELSSTAALCHLDLREYAKAVGASRDALETLAVTPLRRNQLAAHVRLGRALAGANEYEEAISCGDKALSLLSGVQSPRIGARLRQLRDTLLHRRVPGAAEFSERYEAAICR